MLKALMVQGTGGKASWLCPKRPYQLSPQVNRGPGRAGRMAAMGAHKHAALLFSFSSSTVKYPFCSLMLRRMRCGVKMQRSVARACRPSCRPLRDSDNTATRAHDAHFRWRAEEGRGGEWLLLQPKRLLLLPDVDDEAKAGCQAGRAPPA